MLYIDDYLNVSINRLHSKKFRVIFHVSDELSFEL